MVKATDDIGQSLGIFLKLGQGFGCIEATEATGDEFAKGFEEFETGSQWDFSIGKDVSDAVVSRFCEAMADEHGWRFYECIRRDISGTEAYIFIVLELEIGDVYGVARFVDVCGDDVGGGFLVKIFTQVAGNCLLDGLLDFFDDWIFHVVYF